MRFGLLRNCFFFFSRSKNCSKLEIGLLANEQAKWCVLAAPNRASDWNWQILLTFIRILHFRRRQFRQHQQVEAARRLERLLHLKRGHLLLFSLFFALQLAETCASLATVETRIGGPKRAELEARA